MFIEPGAKKGSSSLQRSEMDLETLPETLRSAGARVVPITGFYKHLAPLEPRALFGCGLWPRCVICG